MKNRVIRIVENELRCVQDNLYRAQAQFGKMTDKQLAEQYGQSGKTCGSILRGYLDKVSEMDRCVKWAESAA